MISKILECKISLAPHFIDFKLKSFLLIYIQADSKFRKPPIYKNVGFRSSSEASRRGYELSNDPNVAVFEFMPDLKLELNIQTDQFGRVFEDRTHTFIVKSVSEFVKLRKPPLYRISYRNQIFTTIFILLRFNHRS